MFGYEDKTLCLIYTSKVTFEKNVALVSNSEISHYVLLKDFDRSMTDRTNHHGRNIFVDIAYNVCLAEKCYHFI